MNDCFLWITLSQTFRTLNRSNSSTIRDGAVTLPNRVTRFMILSPALHLSPVHQDFDCQLSSQAANAISTSLRAPLLSSSPLSPSHMASGHAPHFSDNFSSERTGHKHQKDVHPAQSQPPSYSHCAQFAKRSSRCRPVRVLLE